MRTCIRQLSASNSHFIISRCPRHLRLLGNPLFSRHIRPRAGHRQCFIRPHFTPHSAIVIHRSKVDHPCEFTLAYRACLECLCELVRRIPHLGWLGQPGRNLDLRDTREGRSEGCRRGCRAEEAKENGRNYKWRCEEGTQAFCPVASPLTELNRWQGPAAVLKSHTARVSKAIFDSTNPRSAYSCGWDSTVRSWDVESGVCVNTVVSPSRSAL